MVVSMNWLRAFRPTQSHLGLLMVTCAMGLQVASMRVFQSSMEFCYERSGKLQAVQDPGMKIAETL